MISPYQEHVNEMDLDQSDEHMWLIKDGLYLSGISALNSTSLKKHNIRTVLSVISEPLLTSEKLDYIKYHEICVDDLSDSDLLTHFEETNTLIQQSLEQNKSVLVHCLQGVSRSSTIVIAYLMARFRLSAQEMFDHILPNKPDIKPNNGFWMQLALYERLGHSLDLKNPLYRRYIYSCLVNRLWSHVKNLSQPMPLEDLDERCKFYLECLNQETSYSRIKFRCRQCRKILFNQDRVLRRRDSQYHICILNWIACDSQYSNQAGRVHCPKCAKKIGRFQWSLPRLYQIKEIITDDIGFEYSTIFVINSDCVDKFAD